MIELEEHAEGVVLPVRVQAGARRNALAGEQQGRLKVSVTQAPEKGKANQAIADVLCRTLGLRASQIELLAGATHPHKRFLIRGLTRAELAARLAEHLAS